MKIFVKISEGKVIPITVTGELKMMELKIALIDLIGSCIEYMFLTFDDMILEQDEKLDKLCIQNSCTIFLCKPKKILVYIKIENENEIPAVITSNIKVKKQSLYFGNKLLESNKTIFEQGIRRLSTIQLNINFIQDSELLEPSETLIKQDTQSSSTNQLSSSLLQESLFIEPSKTLIDQDVQTLST
ncbi:hypothetical protein CONCODRAFT_2841, partial [Conidiobolus coronatus NRRL 28638]